MRGRVDADLLGELVPPEDCDVFLCGPPPFMQAMYDALLDPDVPDVRVHTEAFGRGGVVRIGAVPLSPVASSEVAVTFRRGKSGITDGSGQDDGVDTVTATWRPGAPLLDVAMRAGLPVDYGCRSGNCGTCRVKVSSGCVTYATPPSAGGCADDALLCCAFPVDGAAAPLIIDI